MQLKIGADPELFVTDDKGTIICAHGLVPGSKEEPYKVPKGFVQVDGTALELGIDPVALRKGGQKAFSSSILQVKADIIARSGKSMSLASFTVFEEEVFRDMPEEAKEMGCDPDHNAWTEQENPGPDPETRARAVGGHVHIGWGNGFDLKDPAHLDMCRELIKQLDASLGLHSVLEDKGTKRRALYGAAGAFRPKPYGVEYRSLSNYWIITEELCQKVYTRSLQAIKDLRDGIRYWELANEKDIQLAINTSNKGLARSCLAQIPAKLGWRVG